MDNISIILPVYNVEKYLDVCITSILNQTFNDFELIIINDGSTDNSVRICNKYKDKDSRIRLIHQENMGLSAARNMGLKNSQSKYVVFIDSDDCIHQRMIEILYENIIKFNADISICDLKLIYDNNESLEKPMDNNITTYTNRQAVEKIVEKGDSSMIIACGKLYKKTLFNEITFPVGKYHEDEFVTYKLLFNSKKIVVTDAKLYFYLQRQNSITGSKYTIKRLDKLDALEEAITFFETNNDELLSSSAMYRYLFNITIAYYRVKYDMKYNIDILDKLKFKYKLKYEEFQKKDIVNISILKRNILRFFYMFPNTYCFIVRLLIFPILKIKERRLK